VSGLILPGLETPRVSRRHRLAAKAKERREAPGAGPNLQPRLRGIPPVAQAGIVGTPAGPGILINYADGQQQLVQLKLAEAAPFAVALISAAAQFELLQRMQADQAAADSEPVPVSPEAEALLAEAIANIERPVSTTPRALTDLKGDKGDVDDDPDLADYPRQPDTLHGFPVVYADGPPPEPKFNSFDVNGQPCYEPPAAD
jgi:hypothetical protein